MNAAAITLTELGDLVGGVLGRHDVACPQCGPSCRSPANRRRRVLRIWYSEPNFATFKCQRCEIEGYAVDRAAERADPAVVEKARAKARERQRIEAANSLKKARWLWSQRRPIIGSIAETYLRECRGYQGMLPGTLGFLPARGEYLPAMIAAFGTAAETLPGEIVIYDAAVRGVHLTKLKPDGSDKAGTDEDKLTIGISNTSPIWLAPPNDGLGLAIAEGIEDGLSVHQATGLGAWAAGTAGRLPAMADYVPPYINSVTIMVDADPRGEKNATELARRLDERGIEVLMVRPAVPS
jgi:hypothetical protein